jgi:hypothetical protein
MTSKLKKKYSLYMMVQHYMVHKTNLVVQSLSNLHMVAKLKDLLQSLYSYFSISFKQHLEFTKLVKIVDIWGLKILWNAKIQWVSMLEPWHVMEEYKTSCPSMNWIGVFWILKWWMLSTLCLHIFGCSMMLNFLFPYISLS